MMSIRCDHVNLQQVNVPLSSLSNSVSNQELDWGSGSFVKKNDVALDINGVESENMELNIQIPQNFFFSFNGLAPQT